MLYEFRIDGEIVEVTLSKNDDVWTLSGNNASILPDGRIRLISKDNTIFFAHSIYKLISCKINFMFIKICWK